MDLGKSFGALWMKHETDLKSAEKDFKELWSPSIWSISLSWCEDYFNLGLDDEAILDLLLYVSCQFEPLDCSFVAKSLFILVQVVPPNRDELRSFTSSKYTATPAWRHTRTLWHTGDTGLVTPGRPGTDRVHGPWVWMTCVHSGCWPRHLSWLCPSHVWKHTSAATWMMHNHPWFCQRKPWIAATFWCHFVRRRRRMWWSPDTSGWCLFSSLSETIRGWKRLESDLLIYPGPSELICAPRFIMIHFRIRLVRSGRMQLVVLDAEGGFVAGGLERVKNATATRGFSHFEDRYD